MSIVRIFGIAPYSGIERIMRQIAAQRPEIQLITRIGNLRNWQEALNSVPTSSYDVIISRGGTARALARHAKAPIVEIPTSVYDMLCSLHNAQGYTGKIAVVGHSSITDCAKQLAEIMQYDVVIAHTDDNSDIRQVILQLKNDGCNLILGDIISQRIAAELGLNSMLITSSEQSVQSAIDEAVRLIQAQDRFSGQNELFRQLIRSEWDELVVFRPDGQLYYATQPEDVETSPFYEMLRQAIPQSVKMPIETECEWNGHFWRISGRLINVQNESLIALRLKKSNYSLFSEESGVSLSNQQLLWASDVEWASIPFSVGTISDTISSYSATPFPILLLGEEGTGKDYAAIQLYQNSQNCQNALITLDCQIITGKRWKQLLKSDDSPLLSTGMTFYFKNLDKLSDEQAEELFRFMEISCAYRSNRMIFSAQQPSTYACTYLQGHFSTLLLQLPPLRDRREDIPNLLSLSINKLNILLGKQVAGFTVDALALMKEYPWDGNLAQLDRVTRTLVTKASGSYINRASVEAALQAEQPSTRTSDEAPGYHSINLQQSLADIEYDVVRLILQEENNNQSKAARRLNIGRSTLWNMLKKHE
jgi:transcriptional regulator with PAS, ATPase and Fis domain